MVKAGVVSTRNEGRTVFYSINRQYFKTLAMNEKNDILMHLIKNVLTTFENTICIKASGWSMQPVIFTNDKLIVMTKYSKLQCGDIVSYRRKVDFALVAHRIIKRYGTREGNVYILKGDASPFVDNGLVAEKYIIGVVIEVHRLNGRIIKLNTIKYRILKKILPRFPLYSMWTYKINPWVQEHLIKHMVDIKRYLGYDSPNKE